MRASDADRDAAASLLGAGCADLVLGRSSRCDVVMADPSVSRRHLEVRPTPAGGWYAVDLGSTNGTWLLGRRTARTAVAPGDELVLGHAVVRFER